MDLTDKQKQNNAYEQSTFQQYPEHIGYGCIDKIGLTKDLGVNLHIFGQMFFSLFPNKISELHLCAFPKLSSSFLSVFSFSLLETLDILVGVHPFPS